MKITSLDLKNFRNHKDTRLLLGKYNFFVGGNGAGKSSVLEALQFVLTGKNLRETIPKSLIQAKQTTAMVETEIGTLGVLERTATANGNIVRLNGSKLPDREAEKEMIDVFELSYEMLDCILSSRRFINLPLKEQKDFLFQVSGIQLTPDKVVSFLEKPSLLAEKLTREELKATTIKFDNLDKAYSAFHVRRRETKKELATIKAKYDFLENTISALPAYNKKEKEVLSNLQLRRDEIIAAIAVINSEKSRKEKLEARLLEHRAKYAKLQAQCTVTKEEVEKIPNLKAELDVQINLRNEFEVVRKVTEEKNKTINVMLGKLNTTKCPLNEALVCKTDKSTLQQEFKKELAGNEKIFTETKVIIAEKDAFIVDTKKKISLLESQKVAIEGAERELASIHTLASDLATMGNIGCDTSLKKDLQALDIEIASATEAMRQYTENEKRKAEHKLLMTQYEALKKEVEAYEYLVEEFSPDGVKARILKKVISPIVEHCNKKLKELKMGEIEFDFQKGISVISADGAVEISSLSLSERLRLGVVFQDTFSSLTGAKVLIVDEYDMLDDENSALMLNILKGDYETVVVAGTLGFDEATKLFGQLPENKLFEVKRGTIKKMVANF